MVGIFDSEPMEKVKVNAGVISGASLYLAAVPGRSVLAASGAANDSWSQINEILDEIRRRELEAL